MISDGRLVQGHLEQIKRCDLRPHGWFLDIEGAANTSVSQWKCANMSIPNPAADCFFNDFWDVPTNATYHGVESCPARTLFSSNSSVGRTECDRWSYWRGKEQFMWWALKNLSVPVQLAKVVTDPAHPTYHKWHLEFHDFKAGEPPISAFSPPIGLKSCQTISKPIRNNIRLSLGSSFFDT